MIRGKSGALLLLILVVIVSGCAQQQDTPITPTEAHNKLIQLCKSEYNLNIVTKAFDNTLWIYLPLEEPYLLMTSSKNGPIKSPASKDKPVIKYLDGHFENGQFNLMYDIRTSKSYTDDKGIKTKYTEEYSAKQQFLLGAINRAYGNIEQLPDSKKYAVKAAGDVTFLGEKENLSHKRLVRSHVKTEKAPDFIVIVIADIRRGIESRIFFYLKDLRRAFTDPGFGEEYIKRLVNEQPIGHEVIIGDKNGSHLNAYDLTWPEFLLKQMLYRATLKYTLSSFPPLEDAKEQLIQIAAETIQAYDFNDFLSFQFTDLGSNTTDTISRLELISTPITPPRLPGKIHKIKFEIGAPEEGGL